MIDIDPRDQHLAKLVDAELSSPSAHDTRGEDMAFAAGSMALVMACNAALPIAGGLAAAASLPVINKAREDYTKSKPTRRDHIDSIVDYECFVRQLGTSPGELAWEAWLPWGELRRGAKVPVPTNLPHPKEIGFTYTTWAKDVGEVANWVRSLRDGSRLHVHEFADGTLVVHRDAIDPARGPVVATFHWLGETPEGNVLGAALFLGALGLVWGFAET